MTCLMTVLWRAQPSVSLFIHSLITSLPMSLMESNKSSDNNSSVPLLHSTSIAARLSSHIYTHIPNCNMHCILAICQCQCPGALNVSSACNAIKTPSKVLGHLANTWPWRLQNASH